jgi:histidinol-phosphate aminotransferase
MSADTIDTQTVDAAGSASRLPSPTSRTSYSAIELYAPNRAPCRIDLSDNTNLWGVPPNALAGLHAAATASVTRYPALYAGALKRALAAYAGVGEQHVVTGCGSDDVLDSAMRAFAEPGERVACPTPSFAMIPIFARMNGLVPVEVPLRPDFGLDADAMLQTDARVIYVCSPNNPTGTLLERAAVERVIERAPGVVIVDEAYAEFVGGGMDGDAGFLREAAGLPNVLVVRTMSKAFGLAGLRIGYATGSAAVVAEVEKSRGPYKVNALAEQAAVAALTTDRAWVADRVRDALASRERLAGALRALGLTPLPSAANFLLVPVPDAEAIGRAMRERGVAVRPFVGLPHVGDALRISVGPWEMLEECIAALREALDTGTRH